jgi:DNA-binding transcriptional LysR family regulator
MELRTLRAFVEVIRQGGFSAAAKTAFSTQSTISKAIRQLEDELGAPLIDRSRIAPTAAGEIVFAAPRRFWRSARICCANSTICAAQAGRVAPGVVADRRRHPVRPLFAVYRKRHPDIDIRLQEHGSKRLEELLEQGELDLAASLLPVGRDFPSRRCGPNRCRPAAPGHPAAGRAEVDLAAIGETPVILFDAAFAVNRLIADAYRRRGRTPVVAARTAQVEFMVQLAAAGLGVAFLPRLIAAEHPHPAVRQALLAEPGTDWRLALIWRRNAFLSPAARAWLELSREVYG